MSHATPTALIPAALALTLVACSGSSFDGSPISQGSFAGRTAGLLCRLLDQCECDFGVALPANCHQGATQYIRMQQEEAQEAGLTYDAECAGRKLTAVDEQGCDPLPDATAEPDPTACLAACTIYHGDVPAGEPCTTTSFLASDCARGLVCLGGTCADPCAGMRSGIGEGEPCRDGFMVLGQCAEDLLCDAGNTDTCVAAPGEGQPCPQGACASGLWCEQIGTEATCAPQRADGDVCSRAAECTGGMCIQGECTSSVPTEGEPCAAECADGLECKPDDSGALRCQPLPAEGEDCVTACGPNLGCVEGTCVSLPGRDDPCLSTALGEQCRDGLACQQVYCDDDAEDRTSPACGECPPEMSCNLRICQPPAPAFCANGGGLL